MTANRDKDGITVPDNFVLFPNPASTQIRVSLQSAVGKPTTVRIVNGQGVVVRERQFSVLTQELLSFDLYDLPDGIYWLNVQVEGSKKRARKFIIAK
jgi:hypothetical protein